MSQNYEKLKTLLKELFQLDQPDLDFGFYRIMHATSVEVSQFLDNDLLPQVKAVFKQYKQADKADLEKNLSELIAGVEAAGMDPDDSPKITDIKTRLETAVDFAALESDVYDHLYRFFRRYYSEGDFLAKRVYKPGVYAIPYEGEEIALHWANKDQYYIKTCEYLRDYAFRLRPEDKVNPMRVHFRIVDGTEGEHSNVKATNGENRVFVLAEPKESDHDFIAEESSGGQNPELVISFNYRPSTLSDWSAEGLVGTRKPPTQKDLIDMAVKRVLEVTGLASWITELGKPHAMASGEQANYCRLEAHLRRYTARNTFDFFIHKDLGNFLRRELDFYIKNEVMHLDDVENESILRVERYLSKIKVIRIIAGKIIDFLVQIEEFQKKLWLKKKFVIETHYCIAVGCIPEEFYPEIVANEAQRDEWVTLYSVDQINGDLVTPGYSSELSPEFLDAYPTLVVDTRYFDDDFTDRILESIGSMDEQVDGVLFHGDNFQSLMVMQNRYRSHIDCVYIDPPYNTGDSEIVYKNSYLRSSWLTLIASRLALLPELFTSDPVLFIAIDDFEMVNLAMLIDSEYPSLRREMIIINHHPQGGKAKTLAHTHEYMLVCVPRSSDRTFVGRISKKGIERRPFKRSGTAESNFRYGRPNSFFAVLIDPVSQKVVKIEPPPPKDSTYPTGSTPEGLIRVYPIGSNGSERVWRRAYESCLELVAKERLICTKNRTIYQLIEAGERKAALFSNWVDSRYNAGTFGANLLQKIIGEQNPFNYPKSVHTVEDAIFAAGLDDHATILDYFAGSGTTGHAVINLNREDGRRRKFILVEMGDYFDTVLLPRLKKVTFTPEWKNGKPLRHAKPEEAARSPRIVKVLRLESFEDVLNNLEIHVSKTQQTFLDSPEAQSTNGFREQYILRYMLDVETRGSQSLLNTQAFVDPTAYKLKVKRPGSDESREVNVDLIETFNWLIGLNIGRISAPQSFVASFKRDEEKRLCLEGRLKQETSGTYWFRTVLGTMPDGRRAIVIWRKLTGDPEKDNLVLDEWFTMCHLENGSQFDVVWVNGGNNLENLKRPGDLWRVRLIDEDFHRLMFDTGRQ